MKNARILFVDDEVTILDLYSILLSKYGHTLSYKATCGEDAIDIYNMHEDDIDLIILDLSLGSGIDGLLTYKNLVKINPNIQVIIISGHSIDLRLKELIDVYKCQFLLKPLDIQTVLHAIENV